MPTGSTRIQKVYEEEIIPFWKGKTTREIFSNLPKNGSKLTRPHMDRVHGARAPVTVPAEKDIQSGVLDIKKTSKADERS